MKFYRIVYLFSLCPKFVFHFRLLSENPDYIHKFKHLATIPAEQLPYHNKLTAHALSILYSIHSMMDSLSDEETLRELIRKVSWKL